MKYALGSILATAVLWMTSAASAQTGLYGSPEMISLPTMGGGPSQQANYPNTATLPSSAVRSGTMPVSYGQEAAAPSPSFGQGYPGYLAQATSGPPLPPTSRAVSPAAAVPSDPTQACSAPISSGPSVLDQLLRESGGAPAPVYPATSGCGGACGLSPSAACDDCEASEQCFRSPWYGLAAGLYLARDHGKRLWTTYETDNNPNQLMNTNDAGTGWRGGGEVRLGRRFCCDSWAVEGTFWSIDAFSGYASVARPGGGLSTPEDFDYFTGPGSLFDNADVHVVSRRNEIYNTELNFLRTPLHCGAINIDWLVGFRWFHFREHLSFGTLGGGGSWANPDDVAYMDDRIENDLLGGQVGLSAKFDLGYRLSVFARPKVGIYNNHIDHRFNVFNGAGTSFQPDPGSGITDTFPGESDTNTFSVLTEIDIGLQWQYHEQWSAMLGYRLMAATGIGLADEQIPFYPVDIPEWKQIDHTGHLIMHGVFAGLQYNF